MDLLFGLNAPASLQDLVHAGEFHDPVSATIAEELLTDANIPFLKKERGSGTAVRIITGFQPFGTDFFVLPEDLERAKAALIPLSEPAEFIFEDETQNSEETV